MSESPIDLISSLPLLFSGDSDRISRRRRHISVSNRTQATNADVVLLDSSSPSDNARQRRRRRRNQHDDDIVDLTCVTANDDVIDLVDLTSPSPSHESARTIKRPRKTIPLDSPKEDPATPAVLRVNCPICLEPLSTIIRRGIQIRSTVCGHVFCQPCIKSSIQTTKKCPTCRKKLTDKNTHPLYLPIS